MKANVYRVEELTPSAREGVMEGIGMVAAYSCHDIVVTELRARLVHNSHNKVNPRQIGTGNLDNLTELHIFAVPLENNEGESLGLANVGRGCAFVDISNNSQSLIRATTAHETSHALGFVTSGTSHEDPRSPHHCSDESCVMGKTIITNIIHRQIEVEAQNNPKHNWFRLKRKAPAKHSLIEEYEVADQHMFCRCCAIDMRTNSTKHIEHLRYDRLFGSKKV